MMRNELIQDTIDALDSLLEQERTALLNGELDKISHLHARKVELVDALNKLDVLDQRKLQALSLKVSRNQDLLNSAADGIRAVAQRLATVRRVRQHLETYDENGQRKDIKTPATGTLEKRA